MFFLFGVLVVLAVIGMFWRRRYQQQQRQKALRELRRWIGEHTAIDPTLQRWVAGLSPAETHVLLDLLNGYCTSLNWELSWLFSHHLEKTPVLKQALEEGLVAYANSILASLQLIDDVHAYRTYVALTQKPAGKRQFALIQKLYKTFGERGVIVPVKAKRRWLSRQPTRKQQIAAVISAFDQDSALAMDTLKLLLVDEALSEVRQVVTAMPRSTQLAPLGAGV
ncbi:MAG: hypothetical protein KF832_15845 [Caldilineaceae bacterium]|nr:hypothetical protein [Caldilineaceae bacterium]